MKTVLLSVFTLAIVFVGTAKAGQTTSETTYGSCSPNMSKNSGSITINCTGLDPAVATEIVGLVKQLSLLNKKTATEKNQQLMINMLKDIKSSLEAATNQPTIQVTNNFRSAGPGPEIKVLNLVQRTQEIPAPNSQIYAMKGLPIPRGRKVIVEDITFSVGSPFYHPAFQILCQRACQLISYSCIGSCSFEVGPQPQPAEPNIRTILFTQPLLIGSDEKLVFTILADDDKAMDFPVISPLIF
jgi:hypothetical protein